MKKSILVRNESGFAIPAVLVKLIVGAILIWILLILMQSCLPNTGGKLKSYGLSGPATIPVGGSEKYAVTVNLDGPGMTVTEQMGYLISGNVPASRTYSIDLVEADYFGDDVLHDDVKVTIPMGQTSATVELPISCPNLTTIQGPDDLSNGEATHQLRVEGWGGWMNPRPFESDLRDVTCVTPPPPPPPPPPPTCDGAPCSVRHRETVNFNAPCPQCRLPSDRPQLSLAVRLVIDSAKRLANQRCPGQECRCEIYSADPFVENCRVQNGKCLVDVTVMIEGSCKVR